MKLVCTYRSVSDRLRCGTCTVELRSITKSSTSHVRNSDLSGRPGPISELLVIHKNVTLNNVDRDPSSGTLIVIISRPRLAPLSRRKLNQIKVIRIHIDNRPLSNIFQAAPRRLRRGDSLPLDLLRRRRRGEVRVHHGPLDGAVPLDLPQLRVRQVRNPHQRRVGVARCVQDVDHLRHLGLDEVLERG